MVESRRITTSALFHSRHGAWNFVNFAKLFWTRATNKTYRRTRELCNTGKFNHQQLIGVHLEVVHRILLLNSFVGSCLPSKPFLPFHGRLLNLPPRARSLIPSCKYCCLLFPTNPRIYEHRRLIWFFVHLIYYVSCWALFIRRIAYNSFHPKTIQRPASNSYMQPLTAAKQIGR